MPVAGKVAWPAGALVAFLVPFTININAVLNSFYNRGALFHDTGLFASLLYRSGWQLSIPPVGGGGSYYATHFAPLLSCISLLSESLPLWGEQLFALFLGVANGLLGLAVYLPASRVLPAWAALLVSQAFAFSGLANSIASFPHIEILIPALQLLFYYFLCQNRLAWSWVCFLLALTVREDAGFHFTAVLFFVIAYRKCLLRHSWRDCRRELGFLIFGFGWSLAALLITRTFFPGDAAFQRIYSGDPPFAHLTPALIRDRLALLWRDRAYLWLPVLLLVGGASLVRRPAWVLGLAAFVPWIALNLLAHASIPGSLYAYYAYPLLVAFGWPVFASLADGERSRSQALRSALLVGVLSLAGVLAWWMQDPWAPQFWSDRLNRPDFAGAQKLRNFLQAELPRQRPLPAPLRADAAVISFSPHAFETGEWLLRHERIPKVKGIFYWAGYLDVPRVALNALFVPEPRFYELPGTRLRLLAAGDDFAPGLTRKMRPLSQLSALQQLRLGERQGDHYVVRAEQAPGIVCSTNYGEVPAGHYEAEYELEVLRSVSATPSVRARVMSYWAGDIATLNGNLNSRTVRLHLPFSLKQPVPGLEVLLEAPLGADVKVLSYRARALDAPGRGGPAQSNENLPMEVEAENAGSVE